MPDQAYPVTQARRQAEGETMTNDQTTIYPNRTCTVCGYVRPNPAYDDDRVIVDGTCEDCLRDEQESDEHDYPDDD
jgi:hypothetical protein